ncbi:MAG: tRNA pseudouridine(38-40) synthase TruA [Eubacterium sp.]|nr:tRNA pseudouridine(38-40) synthase TruA [Eubacterium sp.]
MKRYMLTVAYDGTGYCGWQLQPNGITVEEELNTAISGLLQQDIQVIGASRTDSGVHAFGNVCVFDADTRIPAEKLALALNQRLPEDIRIRSSREVAPDFHPRHTDTIKTYEYKIYNDRIENPVTRLYSKFCYYKLDIAKMQEAAAYIVGEHDFTAFCSAGSSVQSKVRTIYSCEVFAENTTFAGESHADESESSTAGESHADESKTSTAGESHADESKSSNAGAAPGPDVFGRMITIRITGNGFLYNMVRIIAGTLIDVGTGRTKPSEVGEIIESKDRSRAGDTAEARGLTLVKIYYPELDTLDDKIK